MYDVPASKLNPITPELRDGRHVLAWDDVSFEVDARTGGRVTALRLGGRNLLTGPEIDAGNFGSTFWTSPQSAWGWPPVPEVDHHEYRAVDRRERHRDAQRAAAPAWGWRSRSDSRPIARAAPCCSSTGSTTWARCRSRRRPGRSRGSGPAA